MSTSASLVEITQAALARLRSPEFNMRIVQLQSSTTPATSSSPSVVSSSDIDMSSSMWKHKWGAAEGGTGSSTFAVSLPAVLIEYYKALQSDGLHFAASVARSSAAPTASGAGGDATTAVAAMAYVCSCRLHRIMEISPLLLSDAETLPLQFPAGGDIQTSSARGGSGGGAGLARGTTTNANGGTGTASSSSAQEDTNALLGNNLYSPRATAARVRTFLLSPGATESTTINGVDGPRSPICDVILVFREKTTPALIGGSFHHHHSAGVVPTITNNNPEVWGRNTATGRLFYLCRTVEDYIRLGCRMYWVSGWQLCFDIEQGPPDWSMPWMRLLCPGPLSQALSIAR